MCACNNVFVFPSSSAFLSFCLFFFFFAGDRGRASSSSRLFASTPRYSFPSLHPPFSPSSSTHPPRARHCSPRCESYSFQLPPILSRIPPIRPSREKSRAPSWIARELPTLPRRVPTPRMGNSAGSIGLFESNGVAYRAAREIASPRSVAPTSARRGGFDRWGAQLLGWSGPSAFTTRFCRRCCACKEHKKTQ